MRFCLHVLLGTLTSTTTAFSGRYGLTRLAQPLTTQPRAKFPPLCSSSPQDEQVDSATVNGFEPNGSSPKKDEEENGVSEAEPVQVTEAEESSGPRMPIRTNLLGGDYAGVWINIDKNGDVDPLPDHHVPAAMKEWDQAPVCYEVITSEDSIIEDAIYNRRIITILPETGCGVDNLEVLKSEVRLQEVASYRFQDDEGEEEGTAQCFFAPLRGGIDPEWLLDIIFDANSNQVTDHRVRLGIIVKRLSESGQDTNHVWEVSTVPAPGLSSPFFITWERQFNKTSSSGGLAKGGGLDGQSVSRWIGDNIEKHFSTVPNESVESKGEEQDLPTTQLNLPCNLTLSFGYMMNEDFVNERDLFVDVSHRHDDEEKTDRSVRWTRWIFSSAYATPADAFVTFGVGDEGDLDDGTAEIPEDLKGFDD